MENDCALITISKGVWNGVRVLAYFSALVICNLKSMLSCDNDETQLKCVANNWWMFRSLKKKKKTIHLFRAVD